MSPLSRPLTRRERLFAQIMPSYTKAQACPSCSHKTLTRVFSDNAVVQVHAVQAVRRLYRRQLPPCSTSLNVQLNLEGSFAFQRTVSNFRYALAAALLYDPVHNKHANFKFSQNSRHCHRVSKNFRSTNTERHKDLILLLLCTQSCNQSIIFNLSVARCCLGFFSFLYSQHFQPDPSLSQSILY